MYNIPTTKRKQITKSQINTFYIFNRQQKMKTKNTKCIEIGERNEKQINWTCMIQFVLKTKNGGCMSKHHPHTLIEHVASFE